MLMLFNEIKIIGENFYFTYVLEKTNNLINLL
jgi:hypothetical protein